VDSNSCALGFDRRVACQGARGARTARGPAWLAGFGVAYVRYAVLCVSSSSHVVERSPCRQPSWLESNARNPTFYVRTFDVTAVGPIDEMLSAWRRWRLPVTNACGNMPTHGAQSRWSPRFLTTRQVANQHLRLAPHVGKNHYHDCAVCPSHFQQRQTRNRYGKGKVSTQATEALMALVGLDVTKKNKRSFQDGWR
jgi:hypothetical protein